MKCNLALYILMNLLQKSAGQGKVSVTMSHFREINDIPPATFHRHLNSLIEVGFIVRDGRDKYRLSMKVTEILFSLVEMYKEDPDLTSEFQLELPL